MADKTLPNVKVLRQFLLGGKAQPKGKVLAKTNFKNPGEWQNLANMKPPRVEETDEKVGEPSATKAAKTTAVPGV